MQAETRTILEHLLVALAAGALIGLERSYHGRPAGFRTHTLVCIASSTLMLVTMYPGRWFPDPVSGSVSVDPTRMAQGIMTGIGFLGAGVIFKEGLTVRGLTTAASIWITAAIGILAGIGFYFPVIVDGGLLTALGENSASAFLVKNAGVGLARLEVGLIPADDPFIDFLAAVLNAGIAADDLEFQAEFEVIHGAVPPNQERVSLRGILGRGFAGDRAILDGPEFRISIPAGKIFPVEDRLKAGIVGAESGGRAKQACH